MKKVYDNEMQSKINALVEKLGHQFKDKHLSLVSAESCSAGGIAYYISQHPSCSFILERGFIVYSNESKRELLQVKAKTLQLHGAVSKETALEMAKGALQHSNAHISVATTGLGGDNDEPGENNGMVWIACASVFKQEYVICKKVAGERKLFGEQVIYEALKVLLSFMESKK